MTHPVDDAPVVRLRRYDDPWPEDDPNANFKDEVATYTRADPLETLTGLSELTGIDVGVLARYVLVRWASDGAAAVLELGPRLVDELCAAIEEAEVRGTDAARVEAYGRIRALTAQLRLARDGPRPDPDPLSPGRASSPRP